MSSEPPKDTPADSPTEPFARGRIQWGRPPQQVFRAGPLPSGGAAPRPAPRSAPAADFLTGSMVPPARPAPVAAEAPTEAAPPVEAEAIVPPPPLEPESEPVIEPVFETLAPKPEPVVEPAAAAPQEIVIEPEAAEPAVTVPPPLSSDPQPTAKPRELPSVVVTPTLYATMGAAVQKAAKGGRWTIVAGVAAVVIIGGFIWLATLPAPQPVDDAPTPLAAGAVPIIETPLIEEAPPPAAVTASTPTPAAPAPSAAVPAATASGPVPTAPRRPTSSAPIVIAPTETAPRPYIETAPLVVDPPTSAEPAQTDPDAPITTRPQPLD